MGSHLKRVIWRSISSIFLSLLMGCQKTNSLASPVVRSQPQVISANAEKVAPAAPPTDFYAEGLAGRMIRFDLFRTQNSEFQMVTVDAGPGDRISASGFRGFDGLDTGWTLVDIRDDPHNDENRILIFVSDDGAVLRRDLIKDQRSEEYRRRLRPMLGAPKNLNPAPANSTPAAL